MRSNKLVRKCPEELCRLSSWGFPDKVISRYEALGVKSLFPWQVECLLTLLLSTKKVDSYAPSNLIYSAPTSGGKTLVAEILMLKRLAERKGTIFFVVPFVALAEEKTAYFQHIWQDMNIGIKAFHGEDGGGLANNALTADVDVAVCTIERANILLTQLYDDNRAHQLSMVVIDEIHMLADSHRGFLLEVLLSKILYSAKCDRNVSTPRSDSSDRYQHHPVHTTNDSADAMPILVSNEAALSNTTVHSNSTEVQIVGMSATLPNISDLSTWLGASLYTTAYRPVHLDIKVCMDRSIYKLAAKSTKEVAPHGDDYIHQMVSEYLTKTGIEQEYPPPQWMYHDDNSNESLNIAMQETFRIEIQSESATTSSSSTSLYAQVSAHSERSVKSTSSIVAALESNLQYERALADVSREDIDGLHRLCLETIAAGKSVMLFCNSKRRCEVCAKNIADAVANSETSKKERKSTPMVYQSIQSTGILMSSTTSFQPVVETPSIPRVMVINEKKSLAVKYSGAALGQESPAGRSYPFYYY